MKYCVRKNLAPSWKVVSRELLHFGYIAFLLTYLSLFNSCRYPYNNSLHHHIESIIFSCLESKNDAIVDHLLLECDLIGKILQTDKHPILSTDVNKVDRCNTDVYTHMLVHDQSLPQFELTIVTSKHFFNGVYPCVSFCEVKLEGKEDNIEYSLNVCGGM